MYAAELLAISDPLRVADDFGHLMRVRPAAVLRPRSAAAVSTMINWAAEHGVGFAASGTGHSVYGRAQVENGIVADLSSLNAIKTVDTFPDLSAGSITVEAGATWRQVLDATLPYGLTPPVLTDYLDLSVGGTLAVGGVGATSCARGLQVDHILALEVVTGTGERLTCSPHQDQHLFDAVRAGLGQCAVIIAATVELVPAPERVRRVQLCYPDLSTMITDHRLLHDSRRFDALQGRIVADPRAPGYTFQIDAVTFAYADDDLAAGDHEDDDHGLLSGCSDVVDRRTTATLSYRGYTDRFTEFESTLRRNGRWHSLHPWLTTFVGDAAVDSVVGAELERLDAARDLGAYGQIVLSPIASGAISAPLVRLPEGDRAFAFNLIRVPDSDDPVDAYRLVEANRAIYDRVVAAGGTLYPASAFPLEPDGWQRHFGPSYPRLRSARGRYDPDGLLTPGYGVFGSCHS